MRLLLVEDEPKLGDYLRQGLNESGFVVDLARDGLEGLHLARTGDYELLVLDMMLPKLDGIQVLRELRLTKPTPVLFLTARDDVEDRVRALDLGADDYLVKPFAFVELVARIRALLRRGPTRAPEILTVADLSIDIAHRRVMRAGERLDLTAKEFALVSLLADSAGVVLSKAQIASRVWDMNFDSDTNVVEVAIRRLRAKIDDPFDHKLIHTVRGMGYVLEDRLT